MASEWRKSTWGQEISLEYGKRLRGYSDAQGSFRVFGTNGPVGWTSEPLTPGPGVIVGRKGAYRGVHYSPDPFFVIDTAYYVLPKSNLDMRWLYYAIIYHKLGEINDGSPIPSTTRAAVYVREFQVPPLEEQRVIAVILGSLDDRIELNQRMNRTLEAMARAIFKAWFINFEPVKAKGAGATSFSGMPQAVLEQLPEQLTETELGPIPEGWEVRKLSDICEKPQYGYTESACKEAVGPKFLRIKDINKLPWIEWATVPYCPITEDAKRKYQLHPGDIVIARMADPGHGAMIEDNIDAVFASYLIRFRPFKPIWGRFLQYWLRSSAYWGLVAGRQTGSTRANLNAKVLGGFNLVAPPENVVKAFKQAVDPLRGLLVANVRESTTLASIRDALLPKLISGEVRVATDEGGDDGR